MKLARLGKKDTVRKPAKDGQNLRGKGGIWPYVAVLVIAVAAAIGVVAWMTYEPPVDTRPAEQAQAAQREAKQRAERLEQQVQQAFATLGQFAAQEQLATAFERRDTAKLAELQQQYRAAMPDTNRLALLPAGWSQTDLNAKPPIGYALLDMMRTAEQQQKAPPAEVHLPGQPDVHVNLVQPVVTSTGVAGHIIASYPIGWLEEPLRGGKAALTQTGATLVKAGTASGEQRRLPVAGTRWQLAYFVPAPPAVSKPDPVIPLIALAALVVVIAMMGYLLLRELKRTRTEPAPAACAVAATTAEQPAPIEEEPLLDLDAGIEVSEVSLHDSQPAATGPAVSEQAAPSVAAVDAFEVAGEGVAIDPSILRAYDVRGIVGEGLTPEVVRALGRAIATEAAAAGQQEIVVARDGRLSSPDLSQALIDGLTAGGRQVIDIGRVPTPVMHFATFHLGTGAGVMVTGSHNPRDYNGLKIAIGGKTLSGDAIKALGHRAMRGDFIEGEGSVRLVDVLPDYIDRVSQDVTLHRPLRIVVDCGNGVAGDVAPQVFRALGCEVEELFCEVDGYFPNHHPDPTVPGNLDALISLVRLQGADLGLAFDGDADRLGVVDARGRIIWADRQLMLFARDVLARSPGGHVVFDVKCSAKLAEFVTDNAGIPVMWKSGHSLIRNKMQETNAPLAGDMSGHIFFQDRWYGFDDAIYAGARMLEILSTDERGSVEMFAELPDTISTPEIRIDLGEGEAEGIMAALGEDFANSFHGARVTAIDGIRVDLADGWGLVRASNTQPCLVMRFEADDKDAMTRIQEAFRQRLLTIKPDLDLPF